MIERSDVRWEYRKEHGSYYYYDGEGRMSYMCDEIAVGFSYDPDEEWYVQGMLHKHGPPDAVKVWIDKAKEQYAASDDPLVNRLGEQFGMVVATAEGWTLDQINRCIHNTGFCG